MNPKFIFQTAALSDENVEVMSFQGEEGISQLYRYEIQLKAPLDLDIDIDALLGESACFTINYGDEEKKVHGILAEFDLRKVTANEIYYSAVLVPSLWKLSTYKTNEIYLQKTVIEIVKEVLGNADFDLENMVLFAAQDADFPKREYTCQFRESDFDFISRILEYEGIYYYFMQQDDVEKIVFSNDTEYVDIENADIHFSLNPSKQNTLDTINAWESRNRSIAAKTSVRDYNPEQPSLDIFGSKTMDENGFGENYLYGENVSEPENAARLAIIRAEELIQGKRTFVGAGNALKMLGATGLVFNLQGYPYSKFNNQAYVLTQIKHRGSIPNTQLTEDEKSTAVYQNEFFALARNIQFRPLRNTPVPKFHGTMTAFVYAEAATGVAEVDPQGRYRVHLPFDRADGGKESNDPDRKSSAWVRMVQPYVGEDEGMYFPLKGGTEVLLTFINGDPDRPVITGAIPNTSTPSLMTPDTGHLSTIKTPGGLAMESHSGSYSFKSIPLNQHANSPNASADLDGDGVVGEDDPLVEAKSYGPNENILANNAGYFTAHQYWSTPQESNVSQFPFTKMNDYGIANSTGDTITLVEEEVDVKAHIDRATGPMYVHHVGSTFAYPEQEHVYFCGTFHEDFHVDDLGVMGKKRARKPDGTMDFAAGVVAKTADDPQGPDPEVFHFPEPGGDATQKLATESDAEFAARFPATRKRGVSEDKRWGDQMFFAWGRVFSWAGGPEMGSGGSQGQFNYGNGYTENLVIHMGGTAKSLGYDDSDDIKDQMEYCKEGWAPDAPGGLTGALGIANRWLKEKVDIAQQWIDDTLPDATHEWIGFRQSIDSDLIEALADQRKLYPGTTVVDKTYGGVYSYHLGFAVDIHQGHSISKTYGDSEEYVDGDSETVVKGDAHETVFGDSLTFYMGSQSNMVIGAQNNVAMGLENNMALSGVNNMTIGANSDIFVGVDNEMKLSVSNSMTIGIDMGFQLAGFLKYTGGFGIDKTSVRMDDSDIQMKNVKMQLKNQKLQLSSLKVDLRRQGVSVTNIKLDIIS